MYWYCISRYIYISLFTISDIYRCVINMYVRIKIYIYIKLLLMFDYVHATNQS